MQFPILFVLITLNIYSFFIVAIDKKKSIKSAYRIPEKKLLQSAMTFGSLGFLLAMYIFRHKTRKFKFIFLGWFFLILHACILYYIFYL